jgi:hypothetical protein
MPAIDFRLSGIGLVQQQVNVILRASRPDDLRRFEQLARSGDCEAEEKWQNEKEATGQCVRLGDGKMVIGRG